MTNGKVVAITAASCGTGEAIAHDLAARGAKLVLGARNEAKLRRIVGEIERAGGEAVSAVTDPVDREQVATLVMRAIDTFGRLDVCIANAGVAPLGTLGSSAGDDRERVDVNIKGLLWAIAAVLPVFREQKFGHFIAITPIAAGTIVPGMAVHAGTGAAVAAMCDALRRDMPGQLRVTTLFCGPAIANLAGRARGEEFRLESKTGAFVAVPPDALWAAIAAAIGRAEAVGVGAIGGWPIAETLHPDKVLVSTERQSAMKFCPGR